MNHSRISEKPALASLAAGACAVLFAGALMFWPAARAQDQQAPPPGRAGGQGRGGGRAQAPPRPFPITFTVSDGTTASYKVREQLVGINFPSDAVGTSTAVTGAIAVNKDGSIDSDKSKLTFDLRTLKSDQTRRDNYVQRNTLKTDQYPMAVFVPKTITGMPNPLAGAFGFQLTGDMTIQDKTVPVTWQGIATVDNNNGVVEGRAMTSFPFEKFGLVPPKIGILVSLDDNVALEVSFHFKMN